MTPIQKKADEIYVGFWYLTNDSRIAKDCAIVAVDEIIRTLQVLEDAIDASLILWWILVRQEIEQIKQQDNGN